MAKAESYPNIIRALIGGEPVELAAKITEDELPTRAPRTVIEFSPDNPPMRNGDSFTIVAYRHGHAVKSTIIDGEEDK